MHITFINKCIEFLEFDLKEKLLNYVKQCEQGFVLLGEDSLDQKKFSAVIVSDKNKSRFGIGLCTENFGFCPHILIKPEMQKLIFGFNSEIVFFDTINQRIDKTRHLPMLFNKFIDLINLNAFIVFYETGVVVMDFGGNKLWELDVADVIIDDCVEGNELSLTLMEGGTLKLSLIDGKDITEK